MGETSKNKPLSSVVESRNDNQTNVTALSPNMEKNIEKQGSKTLRLIFSLVTGISFLALVIIFTITNANQNLRESREVISNYHDRSMTTTADLMVTLFEVLDNINQLKISEKTEHNAQFHVSVLNVERKVALLTSIQDEYGSSIFNQVLGRLKSETTRLQNLTSIKPIKYDKVESSIRQLIRIARQNELLHEKARERRFDELNTETENSELIIFILLFATALIVIPITTLILFRIRRDIKFKLYTMKTLDTTQKELQQLAFYDSLTGLANRFLLTERIEQAIRQNLRDSATGALLFIDVDNFKRINDSLGRRFGDEVLKEVSTRLKHSVRATDTVARINGDEFVLLLPNIDDETRAAELATTVLSVLAAPIPYDNDHIFITASIGVSLIPKDTDEADSAIKFADLAMYQSKQLGKNKFRFYNEELNQEATAKLNIENKLRKAIENQDFILFYQPQYSLTHDKVIGVEALIRWQDPEEGLIPPFQFIPVAESTGLIEPIGDWVIEQAIRDLPRLQTLVDEDIVIAINVSARQLTNRQFYENLMEKFISSGRKPKNFEIEITESILMEDLDHNHSQLKRLQETGFGVSIDDFGTGYSSFGYLNKLPTDTLKIDRSFVKDIDTQPAELEIVSAMISLAHNLHLKVVAEGVETKEHMDILRDCNCDIIQGYYYAKPMPLEELEKSDLFVADKTTKPLS